MLDERDIESEKPYHGYDPVIKTHRESQSFHELWLKSDRKMKPVQAAGFTIFGLFLTCAGLFFAQGLLNQFRDNFFMGCCFSAMSLGYLYLGIRGLINVYRSL